MRSFTRARQFGKSCAIVHQRAQKELQQSRRRSDSFASFPWEFWRIAAFLVRDRASGRARFGMGGAHGAPRGSPAQGAGGDQTDARRCTTMHDPGPAASASFPDLPVRVQCAPLARADSTGGSARTGVRRRAADAKRSQSKPTGIVAGVRETRKYAPGGRAPATKQSQGKRRGEMVANLPQRSISIVIFANPASGSSSSISAWGRRRPTHALSRATLV